ncbi:MFS transporter [Nocardia arthritidis]|nr:MFS transporter [Nocardia arthritidis]
MIGQQSRRRWWILGAVCLAALLIGVANNIVNVGLPAMSAQLGTTTATLQWVVDAYIMCLAGLLLVGGYLADRYGRRRMLIIGLLLFAAASAGAAAAHGFDGLVAARAAMGVAAALIYPATLAIIASVFTDRSEKAFAVGLWSAISGIAVASGPLIGGLLLAHFWWGSVFLVNLPLVAITLAATVFAVPESRSATRTPLDLVGAGAAITGIALLLWAIISGPQRGWSDPLVVAAFLAASIVLIGFYYRERRNRFPLLDVRLFANPRFTVASWSITTAFFGLVGFSFMITFYFQTIRGYSPLQAGLAIVPYALVVAAMAPLALALTRRIGTKYVVVAGLSSMSAGFLVATRIELDTPYDGPILLAICLMAVGLAFTTGPATDALLNTVPPERAGVASSVNDTTRELGAALGVAVLGSLLSWTFRADLGRAWSKLGVPQAVIEHGQTSATAALAQAVGAPATHTAQLAFIHGLHVGAYTAAAIAAAGAVLALVMLPHFDRIERGATEFAVSGAPVSAEPIKSAR